MAHFNVAVFTKENSGTVEELLAPYDEQIVYAPYIKYTRQQAIDKVRKEIEDYKNGTYAKYLADPETYKANCNDEDHIKYLEEEFPQKLQWTDEQCYQDMAEFYEEDDIDEEGNLMSTYNPNSKWDWYEEGGRWENSLTLKNGKKCDSALVKDVDFPDDFITFAVVLPNGRWYEKGNMGWWAIVTDKDEDWDKNYKRNFIDKADPEWTITIIDCHI